MAPDDAPVATRATRPMRSVAADDAGEPASTVPNEERAARREALRRLAALIGEEVFY